jgi:glycosyltransferase involved in cell wall biosynthesis
VNAGAELALRSALRELATRGHEIRVVTEASAVSGSTDGIEVVDDERRARAANYQWSDVVITQLAARNRAIRLAARYDRPVVLFLHLGGLDAAAAFGSLDLVVFTAEWLREHQPWSGPSLVLHIPVDEDQYRTSRGDSITLIGLSELKGAQTFYELARRMPDRTFVGVRGAWGEQVVPNPLPPNVTILENTPQMRAVYSRTRILLMPSRTEVFPRVCREAAASGIPTIAHPCDGIREALGNAALFADRCDIDAWMTHIESLDDRATYARQSELACSALDRFDYMGEFDRFEDRLRELTRKRRDA